MLVKKILFFRVAERLEKGSRCKSGADPPL